MLQIMMHVIPRALVNTSGNYTGQRTTVKWEKNAGVIPTPFSRWLHKLLQSEGDNTNGIHSMEGPAWMHSHSWHSGYDKCSAFVDCLNSLSG